MSLLDWSGRDGAPLARVRRYGSAPCISCGEPAVVINPDGDPQHKVCAEALDASEDAAARRYYAQGSM